MDDNFYAVPRAGLEPPRWLAGRQANEAGALIFLVDTPLTFGDERRCAHDYLADTIVVRI